MNNKRVLLFKNCPKCGAEESIPVFVYLYYKNKDIYQVYRCVISLSECNCGYHPLITDLFNFAMKQAIEEAQQKELSNSVKNK